MQGISKRRSMDKMKSFSLGPYSDCEATFLHNPAVLQTGTNKAPA